LIEDARTDALSACLEVEQVGSTVVSMPHYMAQGINGMTSDGLTKAVNGLHTMLDLTVTGVEEMVVFYIGMLTNTYLCLITAAVSGSLSSAISILEDAQNAINSTLSGIANDITTAGNAVESGLNALVSGINTEFDKNPPNINFSTETDKLKNFVLPTNLDADLVKLNSSIPTFQDVKNFTDTAIQQPFEDLKTLMNQSWGNYTFNTSLLPVPDKKSLSFCSGNNDINNFFDDLKKLAALAKRIFIGILLVLALLACIPMGMMEVRRFYRQQFRAKLVKDYATDAMDAVYISSRPYTSDLGRGIANRFPTTKRQILIRWFVAYCTSLPALLLLSLALAGLFSCLCQWVLFRIVSKEVPALAAQVVAFADEIVGSMNNVSQNWATDANSVIFNEGTKLNQDLLGWVNTSTVAINNTLNVFVDSTMNVLNTTFGGTPLYVPITEVFNCLIGLKVQGIEAGLTWVHDHASINFPLLPNNTMTVGDLLSKSTGDNSSFLANPQQASQDDITAAISKVGDMILKSIRQEAIVSFMLLVAWFIVFLIGLITILVQTYGRNSSPAYFPGDYGKQSMSGAVGVATTTNEPPIANPAPAYSMSNNSHQDPFHSSEDELESEKHGVISRDATFSQYQPQPVNYNEKNGFI